MTERDLVIGITASGSTPYVRGALRRARSAGAFTVLMTANPAADPGSADIVLAADTGAEGLTGSTRLKAGTAEKFMLNGFSTVLMIRLGRVYSNLMVGMQPTNAKLRERAVRLLIEASGYSASTCERALQMCGDLKVALILLLSTDEDSVSNPAVAACRDALDAHDGSVRDALKSMAGRR